MIRPVPIGVGEFRELRAKNFEYIDKSAQSIGRNRTNVRNTRRVRRYRIHGIFPLFLFTSRASTGTVSWVWRTSLIPCVVPNHRNPDCLELKNEAFAWITCCRGSLVHLWARRGKLYGDDVG